MIRAVLFDVDGTLLDTERIYVDAWKIAAREFGFELPEESLKRTRALDRNVAEKIFQSYVGERFHYLEVWKRRVEISEEVIAAGTRPLVKPGVPEFLDWLDSRKIPYCIASMTASEKTCSHLERAGLLDRFPVRVTGDEVTHGKPNPEIFLLAAKKLGVEPADCAVFEDSYAGIQAAVNAGMLPIMIPDYVPAREQERACGVVLDSMLDAPAVLADRCGE